MINKRDVLHLELISCSLYALPACQFSLPSPASFKAGPLASNNMRIKKVWLRQLLAEHEVCSWLLMLSAYNLLLGFQTLYDSALS